MGYPASKFEAIYRNDIKDVAEYLDSKYYNKYYIVNLTEDVYDDTPFGNRVIHFGFPDHTPPPFDLLLSVVIFLDLWMSQSDDNIVAVHCLAGKGRTGVIISSLLVYLWYKAGCCHTYDEVALSVSNYFTSERKEGIESINQLNSVYEFSYYCHKLFNHLDKSITTNYVSSPTILLQNVIINTLFTKEELYLVIYTHNSKQTKLVKKNTMWYYPNDVKMNEMASELTFELNLVLSDDISIEFFVNNRTKNIFLGRYMNNTRFLDYNLNYIKLKNSNIDVSDTTLEHRKFTHYFSLTMNYSPILNNLEESWAIPPSILNSSKEPAGSFRIFKDDMDRILCNTSNPDYSIPSKI